MKTVEVVFDGNTYYILTHREIGLGVFGGHARYEWTRKMLNTKDLKMVSKELFEVLKNKYGSRIIKE